MKKFVLYFAVFLVCVTLVYPFSAGAWDWETAATIDYTGQVVLGVRENLNSIPRYTNYQPGDWPETFTFSPYKSGTYSFFSLKEIPILRGHGVVFIWFIPTFFLENASITISSLGLQMKTTVLYNDGAFAITHGSGGAVLESVNAHLGDEIENYTILAIDGVLLKDEPSCTLSLTLPAEYEGIIQETFSFDYSWMAEYGLPTGPCMILGSEDLLVKPIVDGVSVSVSSSAPYYPGAEVQLKADVSGTGILPGTPESTVYWYVHGNTSPDTTIDNDGLLTISNDETSSQLEIEAISTYDSTKSATVSVPVTYPLNLHITPAQTTLITSAKRQEIQFELLLPDGRPFDYSLLEWTTPGADGHYIHIDDNGLLEILPGAPAGTVTVKYAYQHDTGNVSTTSAIVTIVTQQEGIYDQLTPTPDQSDKADQMEDAIGDAADKLENNNSSLGQLTPTRPQINTNLEFDQDQMLAVSPLVTNIWSINGLGRMISIVLVIATVAYIFFGKRDG